MKRLFYISSEVQIFNTIHELKGKYNHIGYLDVLGNKYIQFPEYIVDVATGQNIKKINTSFVTLGFKNFETILKWATNNSQYCYFNGILQDENNIFVTHLYPDYADKFIGFQHYTKEMFKKGTIYVTNSGPFFTPLISRTFGIDPHEGTFFLFDTKKELCNWLAK